MRIDAKKIKQLMVRDGLKQKDVAAMVGMHPTAFSFTLKSGNTTQSIAEHLSVIFKVPFTDIAVDGSDVILPNPAEDPVLLQKIEEILDRRLEKRLAPLVEQMAILNKLIDLANKALNQNKN